MPRIFLLIFLLLFSSSCRSDGAGTSGGVERSLEAFAVSFETVAAALSVAFTQGTRPGEITQYEHILLCDPEGSASIDEKISDSVEDGTFLVEADLDDCREVKGEMSAVGSFARSPDGLLFQWTHDGVVRSGDCEVSLGDLSVFSTANEVPAASFVTGELTADCSGNFTASVRCSWNQVSVLARDELLAACSCTGSGC